MPRKTSKSKEKSEETRSGKGPWGGFFLGLLTAAAVAVIGAAVNNELDNSKKPRPYPALQCVPTEVEVGEEVVCENHSQFATEFQWDFGEGQRPIRTSGKSGQVTSYDTPGEKTISLTAFDPYGRNHPQTKQSIIVVEDPDALTQPVVVSILGELPPGLEVDRRTYRISRSLFTSPGQTGEATEDFEESFPAAKGFSIRRAQFFSDGQKSVSRNDIVVSDDGERVTFFYTLATNPAKGLHRAWLEGDLLVEEQRTSESDELEIASLTLDHLGTHRINSNVDLSHVQSWMIRDADGLKVGSASLSDSISWPRQGLRLSLVYGTKGYRLQVHRLLDLPSDLDRPPTP